MLLFQTTDCHILYTFKSYKSTKNSTSVYINIVKQEIRTVIFGRNDEIG